MIGYASSQLNSFNRNYSPPEVKFITTSRNSAWTINELNKTGATLHWEASGSTIAFQEFDNNTPTFNFSANTARADIHITITSPDGFLGVTALDMWVGGDPDDGGSQITYADINALTELTDLAFRYCKLEYVDLSKLTKLVTFNGRGKYQWTDGLDISNNPDITSLWLDVCDIPPALNIENNRKIIRFDLYSELTPTTSSDIDGYINQFAEDGYSNGDVVLGTATSTRELTMNSFDAYNTLKSRGWEIDMVRGMPSASTFEISQQSLAIQPTNGMASTGVEITPDGKTILNINDSPDYIDTFLLSEPHNLRSISYSGSRSLATDQGTPTTHAQEIKFGATGSKVFITDLTNDGIHSYTLSTPYDFRTAVTESYYNPSDGSSELMVEFSETGSLMFVGRFNDKKIYTYSLSTPWDISTATTLRNNDLLENAVSAGHFHFFNWLDDGYNFLYRDPETYGTSAIVQGKISTRYDFSSTITRATKYRAFHTGSISLEAFNWKKDLGYGMGADYNKDFFVKIRSTVSDTYLSNCTYGFAPSTSWFATTSLSLKANFSTEITMVTRIKFPKNIVWGSGNYVEIAGSTAYNFLLWRVESPNSVYIQIYDGTNIHTNTDIWYNFKDNQWHTILFSYKAGVGAYLFADGTVMESLTLTVGGSANWANINQSPESLFIGGRPGGGNWANYEMSHFYAYNRVFTLDEMAKTTANINNAPTGSLMKLADQKGKYFWKDESGNGFHAGVESVARIEAAQKFPYGSAASLASTNAEFNHSGSFWNTPSNLSLTSSTDAYDGVYSLKLTNTYGSSSANLVYEFQTEYGAIYDIYASAKASGSNQGASFEDWEGFNSFTGSSISTTWTEYSWSLEAISSFGKFTVYVNENSGNTNDWVLLDGVSIKKR